MSNNRPVVELLNDLIETCKDGDYGFTACAGHVKSIEVRNTFLSSAADCRHAADELIQAALQYGVSPGIGGSASGALHRGWVAVRGSLAGYTDQAMLEECERGEDVALSRYRKALSADELPQSLRAMVQRQMFGVQHNHDRVKALRDRFAVTDDRPSL